MIGALRGWAAKYTDEDRYSPVGIVFHWVMAGLVLFQLGWGFYTGIVAPGGDKIFAYQVHSAVGLPILLLAVFRLMWRVVIPGPFNDADTMGWKTTAAHWTHYAFYVCFFGLPLSGWAMWSALAAPGPLYLAGVVPWPQMPFEELPLTMRYAALDIAEDIHHLLVIVLLLLVPAHVGAALKHHFWDRHDVLRGMLPDVPDAEDSREARQHKPKRKRPPAA